MVKWNSRWRWTARIVGGLLFLVQNFFFWLYLTWPFGKSGDSYRLPLYALGMLVLSYPLAWWKAKAGGGSMIAAALFLAGTIMLNPGIPDGWYRLAWAAIITMPSVVVGLLFIQSCKGVSK